MDTILASLKKLSSGRAYFVRKEVFTDRQGTRSERFRVILFNPEETRKHVLFAVSEKAMPANIEEIWGLIDDPRCIVAGCDKARVYAEVCEDHAPWK